MNFFRCFPSSEKNATRNSAGPAGTSTEEFPLTVSLAPPSPLGSTRSPDTAPRPENLVGNSCSQDPLPSNIATQTFTFRELAAATKKFRRDRLIGEGRFGKVYKGILEKTGPVVAVKRLNLNGVQEKKEFLVEVLMLRYICHANVVNLVGYCADGDHRLLVYEYMPQGSLEDHLFDLKGQQHPLDWFTRMRIAYGAAQGLEYIHEKFDPPVTYHDLKTSKILLDENLNPKLSAFGLANLGSVQEKKHACTRVMCTYGYCAPDYAMMGQQRVKSDVFCFGVVLLELISGRRVIDKAKPVHERNLVTWAKPMFRDQRRHPELIDPLIKDDCPSKSLNRAVAVAAMCLQERASDRPVMVDVVMAFTALIAPANETPSPASSSGPPLPDQISIAEGSSTSINQ